MFGCFHIRNGLRHRPGDCRSSVKHLQGSKEQDNRSRQIDTQIAEDAKGRRSEARLLLFGGPNSGKEEILKRMKMLHSGFRHAERLPCRTVVFSTMVTAMQTLLYGLESMGLELQDDLERDQAYIICQESHPQEMTPEFVTAIQAVWKSTDPVTAFVSEVVEPSPKLDAGLQ